ncbi:alpha/beta hydrolase [Arthrobacter pityocampae]|uniref:Alpha/beta hydrolase n=1 Tax=Arthrobacter pityocampae TaxID=547334 RepID=A0A2S5ITV9_9MICC|nr:alpha/beta hydrolase [Arthrobacter pityocampae]PPB47976.1 alpha/beta hydrolase [Arthrobacter pityocampae]
MTTDTEQQDAYREDILGPDYEARTLPLRPDDEGDVVATLVRRTVPGGSRRAVLYVHGFVDYFFQTHLADAWRAAGFDFYALDLRKYGRSVREHQTPNYVTSLEEYDEELDEAARIIREDEGHDVLVVMGHSTGGLVTSLWAHRRRGQGIVDALVLNSPWFDLNASLFQRTLGTAAVHRLGTLRPRAVVGKLGSAYGRYLHRESGGEWDYDLVWKPHSGFPVVAGWLRAIRRGHTELNRGLAIDCPVFVACSDATSNPAKEPERISSTDVVLDVAHIAGRAPKLGRLVTIVRIAGGIHDLALSPEPARSRFFDELGRWQEAYVPGADRG